MAKAKQVAGRQVPQYDWGIIDKERAEYSTTSRGNGRIFARGRK